MEDILQAPLPGEMGRHDHVIVSPPASVNAVDEHDLYPVHEEDSLPVIPRHFWENNYMAYAIQMQRPDHWVIGDTCLYWEQGNTSRYRAPDVAVIHCAPPEVWPNVYLAWKDPPLVFVAEIRSRSTFDEDIGPKADLYHLTLGVPEYLYTNRETQDLRLWQEVDGQYTLAACDADGRVWSQEIGLGFGYDKKDVFRVYTPDGQPLPTYDEAQKARLLSEQRAQSEYEARLEAEQRAHSEYQARLEAEQRAQSSEQRAQSSEQRAGNFEQQVQSEVQARLEAERQVAELMAELQRLRQPGMQEP